MRAFLLLGIIFFTSCGGQSAITLNKDFLIDGNFSYKGASSGAKLKFHKNGIYEFSYFSEGWDWRDTGKYEIRGKQVELLPDRCNGNTNLLESCKTSFGKGRCSIITTKGDLRYNKYLSCVSYESKDANLANSRYDQIDFPIVQSASKNERKQINGMDVITMGSKQAVAKKDCRVKKSPAESAPNFDFQIDPYSGTLDHIPAGTTVGVIAKKVRNDTIAGAQKSWLLIQCGNIEYGWVLSDDLIMK